MKKLFGKRLGLTLLETVVAFAVLLIAILYVLQLYATGQGVFLKSQFRTEAVKLGQEILESKRTEDPVSVLTLPCQRVLSGNYYNVIFEYPFLFSPSPLQVPIVTPVPAPIVSPDSSVRMLDVVVTGPYTGVTESGSACTAQTGYKLAPGNVTVHLQTWVARQKI